MKVHMKQTSTLILWALLAVACTGSSGTTDMSGGPKDCTGCRADQVCSEGSCQDVPSKCPCPKETFCDLASSSCKRGCSDDTNCSAGKYCDTAARTCIAGCKGDENCTAGSICQSQQCVAGCRIDATCGGAGKVCDAMTAMCRPGCRKNGDCTGAGQVCDTDAAKCVSGCSKKTDCAAGKTCDVAFGRCVTQCASGDNSACAANEACVPQPDSSYGCSANCRAFKCKDFQYQCFGSEMQRNQMRCRKLCKENDQCAADESCTLFGPPDIAFLCAKKCDTAGCSMAISRRGGTCTCNATSHVCTDSPDPEGFCIESDPSYGL